MLKAVLVGVVAALVVIAVLGALVALHVVPVSAPGSSAGDGPIAVALVLPNAEGVVTVRLLDVYTRVDGAWNVQSVSPTTSAVVPGTGGTTLADAYVFGGGSGLVSALSTQSGRTITSWVVIDEHGWEVIRASRPLPIELRSDIEVFDGHRLFSFAAGSQSVPATQVAPLFDGAGYLSMVEARGLRSQVGDVLAGSMADADSTSTWAQTSFSSSAVTTWAKQLRTTRRIPGT